MKYNTIKEAAEAWVEGFNSVPMSVIEKIIEYDVNKEGVESISEITPLTAGNRVYIYSGKWHNHYGTINKSNYRGEGKFLIDIDGENTKRIISKDDLEIVDRDPFPMWSTMWAFSDPTDIEWANGEYLGPHLQEIANCGFRIYESEDYGILLGIDAAGFDFYEAFWIPLYKARGLHWHKENEECGNYVMEAAST